MSTTFEESEKKRMDELHQRLHEHEKTAQWGGDIVCKDLLQAIESRQYRIRVPSMTWWIRGEMELSNSNTSIEVGDTFLWRRDDVVVESLVNSPTPEEIPTLVHRKALFKPDMRYYRPIDIVCEYGSTRLENGKWLRHQVAYLKGGNTPYVFKNDYTRM